MEVPQYTGLNIGKALTRPSPEGVVDTLERTAQREEQQKRWETERKQEREDQYLKEFAVKPVYLISKKAREKQSQALEDYNNKYAPLLKKGSDLTLGERTQMAQDKMALEMYQEDLLGKIGEWKRVDDLMQQDKRNPIQKFDHEEWANVTRDFDENIDTKEFSFTPPIKAQSFELALERNKVLGTPQQKLDVIKTPGSGIPQQVTTTSSATEAEAKQHVESLLFDNEAWRKDIVSKFKNLPIETKLQYLDTNKDNKIDAQEQEQGSQFGNPIIEWAKDNYWQRALKIDKSAPKGVPKATSTKTTGDGGSVQARIANASIKFSPGGMVKEPIPYGDQTYSKYSFAFGDKTTLYGIRTKDAKKLEGDWPNPAVPPGSVNVRLVLYDPVKRVFVVETSTGSESADTKTRVLLEVPEKNVSGYENVPVLVGGRTMTIGDNTKLLAAAYDEGQVAKPQTEATPAKEEKKDWSKYKR